MGVGVGDWLRGRVLRWLASGGQGVTLSLHGAYSVTVEAAGQVTVNGGRVVAKGCQVLQDSTGEKILPKPDCISQHLETIQKATGIDMEIEKDIKMRVNARANALIEESKTKKDAKRRTQEVGWQAHNAGSVEDEN